MLDLCHACDYSPGRTGPRAHCNGTGAVQVLDQDGYSRYRCDCSCGFAKRHQEEIDYALAPLIGRYGKKALKEALERRK
jgi:hypothetical protein